ncbi:hypothetical protein [Methylococcus sp. Mc7]|uniref:hypothetical protein n=1 Tax=Methylococcus sp. Mc7 TaxID=2860258 RepID=UPI001C52AD3E|nr:hypothetical protein [Methylococcus sp. Mc7]QXP85487.1 hypothetical protein KW115_07190 [Methylococcus sp. Mc7]
MGVLYQAYCHESADTVAGLVMGTQLHDGGSYPWYVAGYTVGTASVDYLITYFSGTPPVPQTLTVTVPLVSCPVVGPITNASGLAVDDVTQVSWLVAAVLLSAYVIKLLRRAF